MKNTVKKIQKNTFPVVNFRKIFIILSVLFIGIQIIMSAWWVLHSEINFSSDISRDFFLLDELDRKKIVLIGPNSSTGLFHGPLWTYLNYPAYKIGSGSPVVVGWGWIILTVFFTISNFILARKLIGKMGAVLFTSMTSLYMVFHAHDMYNPHGALFLLPLFFFLFIRYIQKAHAGFLAGLMIVGSLIIQFQMAVGIPLVLLGVFASFIKAVKNRKYWHLGAYILIPICLSNFIIFDFRHDHLLFNLLKHYLESPGRDRPDYWLLLKDRITLLLTSPEIARANMGYRNPILFITTLLVIADQIRRKKNTILYLSFLYLYIGFFLLTLVNTGPVLYFYLFPFFPLVFLIFSSLIDSRFKKPFIVLFLVVYAINFRQAMYDIQISHTIRGISQYSWQFHARMDKEIFDSKEPEFGYFVYSPNVLAYEGKYGMKFTQSLYPDQHAYYFTKKPITYIIIAPPPEDNPFMQDIWWRKNKLFIGSDPVSTKFYPNGYKVERYHLTEEEINIPFDPGIDPGLSYR